jgi:BNR repeat protein
MMMRRLAVLGLWVGFLILILPAQAQDQRVVTGVWSQPEYIGDGWWQQIAVDRNDRAYMTWYGVVQNDDSMYLAERDPDGTWTPPNDVIYTPYRGVTLRNAIVVTSDGTLHAVYRSQGAHFYTRVYSSEAYDAADWRQPFRVNDEAYYVSLTASQDDVLHLIYGEQVGDTTQLEVNPDRAECFKCSDVLYRRSTDGGDTWSSPVNLSVTPFGAEKIDIFQGPTGRMFVTWDEGHGSFMARGDYKDVRLIYSDDEGLTWSDPIIFDGGDRLIVPIQIAATELNDGSMLVVWRDRNSYTVYYQTSDADLETWSDPQPLAGIFAREINDTPFDDYALVTDKLGIAHLFLAGSTRLDPELEAGLYHIDYRQGLWRQIQLIYQGPAENHSRPTWPKAVIGPQNDIHLTWFINYDENDPDDLLSGLAVYYSHRSATLPDEPLLAFNPTTTPPTQVAFVPQLEPTPTLFPTVEPLDPGFRNSTSDLYAIRILLGALIVVVILCVSVVLLSGFRPRRR